MNKDFSKYQHIIDDFKGKVSLPNFESRFDDATKTLNKTDRFLLKMEIKRLANPCTRLIDLRGLVDGTCRAYEENGRVHYVDELAQSLFEENVTLYGEYTFGVYEALMNTENNFRVMYQNEKANTQRSPLSSEKKSTNKVFEKTQYPAKLFNYGPYFDRKEERMNFAIALTITTSDNKTFDAVSSDLSIKGCKFRFKVEKELVLDQIISIAFKGLEEEFQFKNEDSYQYQVKNVVQLEKHQFVGVQRYFEEENKQPDGLEKFLEGYIQGNKRRYKINLDNTIAALQSRVFEHFTLPKSNELPIFIHQVDGEFSPKYALTCHNNQSVYQYWQDERYTSTLHCLITPERVNRIKQAAKVGKALYVYSFIHYSQGKSFFYTADNIQLSDDHSLMAEFLAFAASKTDFNITQLSGLDVDPDYSVSPLTLSGTLAKKDAYLSLPPPDDIQADISNLCYIVVANEISEPSILAQYAQLPIEKVVTAKLKPFGHKRLRTGAVVDDVGINFKNQRSEPRFFYQTPVVVEGGDVKWLGKSSDFSASGLKVLLEKNSALSHGAVVNVSFPKLQKITSSFNLKELPYEVVRINKKKNIIHLKVYVEKHQHIGRSFFKALIAKNKDTLTNDEYSMMDPELGKALRNIYSRSLITPSLVIQASGSRYKIETITGNVTNQKIIHYCAKLSDRKRLYNLYPVLNNLQATTLMQSTLKKMQSEDLPIVDVLYIAINSSIEQVDLAVTTKLESELTTQALKKEFIHTALKQGTFLCIQIKLSRTDEPDMTYLNPELSYITSYAIHRGKQLEQEIWSVAGVAQLLDITEEAMFRYQVIPTEIIPSENTPSA